LVAANLTRVNILAATSAAAMFWFVIPETLYSPSILLAALSYCTGATSKAVVLVVCGRQRPDIRLAVTNWMVGIIATIVSHPRKQSLQITLKAFCLVAVL